MVERCLARLPIARSLVSTAPPPPVVTTLLPLNDKRADGSEGAAMATAPGRAEGLRRIFDQRQPVAGTDLDETLDFGGMAERVHHHHSRNWSAGQTIDFATAVSFENIGEMPIELVRIEPERGERGVGKMRQGPAIGHRVGSGDEC